MRLEAEFLDLELLDVAFNIPTLIDLHDKLLSIKSGMESTIKKAALMGDLETLTRVKTELFYITTNIENILTVIKIKEGDLFEFEGFDLICKN